MTEQKTPITNDLSDIRPVKFGRYLLLEKIGYGGMAEIYKAIVGGVANFTKVVVIKRIHMRLSNDPAFVEMFVREANMTASLQHPDIVQVFEMDEVEGQKYIAMEFVNGRDLQKMMARANKIGIHFPVDVALRIVFHVANALSYAYNAKDPYGKPMKIIHRDVSPSNIIASFGGEVKIMDFGVAMAATYNEKDTGLLKGKLGYMSPEQISGKEIDHRSDLFSLGIILFELLVLRRLFAGKTDIKTVLNVQRADIERKLKRHADIPEGVQDILRKLLAREPENRYSTAKEVMVDIENYCNKHGLQQNDELVSTFIHKLFPKESEEEILPLGIEELTDPKIGIKARQDFKPVDTGENITKRKDIPIEDTPVKEEMPEPIEPDMIESVGMHTQVNKRTLSQSSFRLKGKDGQVFGPILYTDMIHMIDSGAITRDELCSVNQEDWVRLRDVKGLKDKFAPNTWKMGQVTFKGKFNKFVFPRLLYRILSDGPSTGRLILKNNGLKKEIDFKDGRIQIILSNLKQELLGNYLLSNGLLSKDDLQKAVALVSENKFKLGDALIRLGLVQPFKMIEYLHGQMKNKFMEIFSWQDGQYFFVDGMEPRKQVVQLDLDPMIMTMEAIRSFYKLEEFVKVVGPHLNNALSKNEHSRLKLESLSLTPRELRAAHLLGANRIPKKAMDVVKGSHDWPLIVYRVTFILVQMGFYKFERASKGTHFG